MVTAPDKDRHGGSGPSQLTKPLGHCPGIAATTKLLTCTFGPLDLVKTDQFVADHVIFRPSLVSMTWPGFMPTTRPSRSSVPIFPSLKTYPVEPP